MSELRTDVASRTGVADDEGEGDDNDGDDEDDEDDKAEGDEDEEEEEEEWVEEEEEEASGKTKGVADPAALPSEAETEAVTGGADACSV